MEDGWKRPLAGLRVVEGATFVAGPTGGAALAQLGAEVIRFDPLGGAADFHRWPLASSGHSLYWTGLNRGKRSLAVDLRASRGRELVERLITAPGEDAGLFVTNAVGQAWLDHETLRRRRPDLIHVHIQGTADGRAGVDYTVNAASGFPFVTGSGGRADPVNHALPAWDLLTGLYVATAVLAAERRRRRTGEGALVRVALADVALATSSSLGLLAEAELERRERPALGNFVYGTFGVDFTTADGGRAMVAAITPRQWRDLVEVTGTERPIAALEEALDADFRVDGDRYEHREVLAGLFRPWFAARTLTQVVAALETTAVLWAPYRSFLDVVDTLRGEGHPLVAEVDQPGVGTLMAAGSPLRFADLPDPQPVPAPLLGQHTVDVLRDVLGLPAQEIDELLADGVVHQHG